MSKVLAAVRKRSAKKALASEAIAMLAGLPSWVGGNAATVYMAHVGDADAVVVLAPGPAPASMSERGVGKESMDKTRALVQSGQGNETTSLR